MSLRDTLTCPNNTDQYPFECDPSKLPETIIGWAIAAILSFVALFILLLILGSIHDWFFARYFTHDEDTA